MPWGRNIRNGLCGWQKTQEDNHAPALRRAKARILTSPQSRMLRRETPERPAECRRRKQRQKEETNMKINWSLILKIILVLLILLLVPKRSK